MENATGSSIIWVDSDEELTRDYVRKQMVFMKENQDVGIAAGISGVYLHENNVLFLENVSNSVQYMKKMECDSDLKLPPTGGSIFRLKAMKEVGGFSDDIKGVGEDQEVASRIMHAGWKIRRTEAVFYEKNRNISSWKSLWGKYMRYGKDNYILYRKRRGLFSPEKMTTIPGLLSGLMITRDGYRITCQKRTFLVPLHYAFKMTAWSLGFILGARGQPPLNPKKQDNASKLNPTKSNLNTDQIPRIN
jgi:hypothetical protein